MNNFNYIEGICNYKKVKLNKIGHVQYTVVAVFQFNLYKLKNCTGHLARQ